MYLLPVYIEAVHQAEEELMALDHFTTTSDKQAQQFFLGQAFFLRLQVKITDDQFGGGG